MADEVVSLGGEAVKMTTHTVVFGDDEHAVGRFVSWLAERSGRRLMGVPDVVWLRSNALHKQDSNDGSRPRIPIVVGKGCGDVLRALGVSEAPSAPATAIPYEAEVYIPGPGLVRLKDTALLVTDVEAAIAGWEAASEEGKCVNLCTV